MFEFLIQTQIINTKYVLFKNMQLYKPYNSINMVTISMTKTINFKAR